jgi:hypothetical protein
MTFRSVAGAGTPSRNCPAPPADRTGLRFRETASPAVPHRCAFARDGRSLGCTAGFRRRAGPRSLCSGQDRNSVLHQAIGFAAFRLRNRERFGWVNFRFPELRALRPPKRRGALSVPPDALCIWLSPSCSACRFAPSVRVYLTSGEDRSHPPALSGNGWAGGSPLISNLVSFLFRICDRCGLSAAPAGSFPGDFPAFIDSRSGLLHQPDASVRVASR